MPDLLRVTVDDGKYTVVQDEQGRLMILRYSDKWLGHDTDKPDIPGSKMIIAMACEIEQMRPAYELLQEYEWSGTRHGQGSGPHGSGNDGHPYAACIECGGLEEPNGEFIAEAVGHRSGCRLAAALGRSTVIPEGETGRLAL